MNLFQKALGYIARSIGLTDPRLAQAVGGRTTTTGEVVSTSSVLGLASAWACVNLLAGTIASLPLMVYRTKGGARTVATDHPLYRILHDSPNADQTAVDFWEFVCASIELSGNAYAEIIRGSNGRVVALSVPVAPELMTVRRLRDGSLEYEWSDNGVRSIAPQDNMLHIRGFGGNPLGGLSTLSFGRQTFGLAQAIERASGDTFRNGVRPSGLLKTADSLTLDQRKQAEELLQEKFAGAINAGRPMLLDLGRNDVGRVSVTGTVQVTEQFVIEKYSHVQHIVSNVQGRLRADKDVLDALVAGFPNGTTSGAPKIRALEIIDELECEKRGIYGGAVGYFSAAGNMDMCIALRTAIVKDGMMYVQAGGGVVADSDPQAEYMETVFKSKALFAAADEANRLSDGLQNR